jgi:hypothetical protein
VIRKADALAETIFSVMALSTEATTTAAATASPVYVARDIKSKRHRRTKNEIRGVRDAIERLLADRRERARIVHKMGRDLRRGAAMSGARPRQKDGRTERTAAPLVTIYDGRCCVGYVLARGRSGYEAFRADGASLGLFPTQAAAIHTISGAAS